MAFGSVPDSVNSPPPPPVMVMLTGPPVVCCGFELSLTLTVRLEVPAVVGIPLTVQLFGASVSPAGSAPVVILQVKGGFPPVTPKTWLYGVPTIPPGKVLASASCPPPPPVVMVRLSGPLVL